MDIISDFYWTDEAKPQGHIITHNVASPLRNIWTCLDVSGTSVPVCPVMSSCSFSGVTHSASRSWFTVVVPLETTVQRHSRLNLFARFTCLSRAQSLFFEIVMFRRAFHHKTFTQFLMSCLLLHRKCLCWTDTTMCVWLRLFYAGKRLVCVRSISVAHYYRDKWWRNQNKVNAEILVFIQTPSMWEHSVIFGYQICRAKLNLLN